MLSRRILTAARPATMARATALPRAAFAQRRAASTEVEETDPGMNGGYENPPAIKRQFRDPHGDWWDKQERRNFGEPVHEDNDIMGVFSLEEYTHFTPKRGLVLHACFITAVLTLCGTVAMLYEDKPSAPRTFEGGLEAELGGPNAVRARQAGEDSW